MSEVAPPLILQFCEQRLECVTRAAASLQPIACEMLKRQFSQCGVETTELLEDGHLFSLHFKQTSQAGWHHGQDTSLQALATVAASEMQATSAGGIVQQRMLLPARGDSAMPPNLLDGASFESGDASLATEAWTHPRVDPTFSENQHGETVPPQIECRTMNASTECGGNLGLSEQTGLNGQISSGFWEPEDLNELVADLFGGLQNFPDAIT